MIDKDRELLCRIAADLRQRGIPEEKIEEEAAKALEEGAKRFLRALYEPKPH